MRLGRVRSGSRRAGLFLLSACCYAPAGIDAAPAAEAPSYELKCGEALTVWRKARDPGARDCCALVARARAGLWTAPERTRELSARASTLCPSGLEAASLSAASLLASGAPESAHAAFERVSAGKNAERFAQLPPGQRLLAARAASLAGKRSRALDHYRSVILELDQLPSPHERARVLLEAALLAAHSSPPELAEAHAYLRQSAEHLSPRLVAVRRLVARAIGPSVGQTDDTIGSSFLLEDATDAVLWMQTGARASLAAPGELLPAVDAELLAALLPSGPAEIEEPL